MLAVVCSIVLVLAACAPSSNPDSNVVFGSNVPAETELASDFQADLTSSFDWITMCASDSGYYVYLWKNGNETIYMDKASLATTPLCAKPECDHTDYDTCNAKQFNHTLTWHDGGLYFVRPSDGGNEYIVSAKADGTSHVNVQEYLDWDALEGYSYSVPRNSFAFLDNYIVYTSGNARVYGCKVGDTLKDAALLFSYDEPQTMITDMTSVPVVLSDAFWNIWVDGNHFYYVGVNHPEGDTSQKARLMVYRWDPLTNEIAVVWDCRAAVEDAVSVDGWYLREGVFYYYLSDSGLWSCNLNDGNCTALAAVSRGDTAEFDAQYAYICSAKEMQIDVYGLDDGTTVTTLDFSAVCDNEDNFHCTEWNVVGADETYLFVGAAGSTPEGGSNLVRLYAIEKEKFQGNEWLLAYEFGAVN